MGLTQAPAHFQFVVESVLHGEPGNHPLPLLVYFDDIAMYGDTQEKVPDDTLEAIKQLAAAGIMLNLHKSQLVQATEQVKGQLSIFKYSIFINKVIS